MCSCFLDAISRRLYCARVKLRLTFGRLVRRGRFEYGLDQDALAKAVDVSRTTISNIERGYQSPNLALALRIARELDLSLDSLK